jgi:hypothetical protein
VEGTEFLSTTTLIQGLIATFPETWGRESGYGKDLTVQRLGRMLVSSYNIHGGVREGGVGPRGYTRRSFDGAWRRMGVVTSPAQNTPPPPPDSPTTPDEPVEPAEPVVDGNGKNGEPDPFCFIDDGWGPTIQGGQFCEQHPAGETPSSPSAQPGSGYQRSRSRSAAS